MGRLLILNASPRAPRSHSKEYARLLAEACRGCVGYQELRPGCLPALSPKVEEADDLVLVFPLYADSLPVPLIRFLKELEASPPARRPVVSVVVNCGFLEPHQNDIAVEMVQLFCEKNGYPFGSAVKIASGEAILSTPFRFLVRLTLGRMAASLRRRRYGVFQVTMPLPKKVFLKASTAYWTAYGRRGGVTPGQMAAMDIEPDAGFPS